MLRRNIPLKQWEFLKMSEKHEIITPKLIPESFYYRIRK